MICELTEMDTTACAHCRQATGPAWEAKYNTVCRTCGEPIDIGNKVSWSQDGASVQHAHHR